MREKARGEGFMVLDSSYTQASDPNTMRNFGFPRNIVYNIKPVSELSKKPRKKDQELESKSSQASSTPSSVG